MPDIYNSSFVIPTPTSIPKPQGPLPTQAPQGALPSFGYQKPIGPQPKTMPVVTGRYASQQYNTAQSALGDGLNAITQQAKNKASIVQPDPVRDAALSDTPFKQLVGANPAAAFYRAYGRPPQEGELAKFQQEFSPDSKIDQATQMLNKTQATQAQVATTPEAQPTGTETAIGGLYQGKQDTLLKLNEQANKTYDELNQKLDAVANGTYPLNPAQQAQIDSIKAMYERTRSAQEQANKAFETGVGILATTSGRQRYAPDIALGEHKAAVDQGIQKLQDLDANMAKTLSELQTSFQESNYRHISERYERFRTLQKDRTDQISKMYDDAIAFQKDIYAQNEVIRKEKEAKKAAEDKSRQDILKSALEGGASPEILKAIQGASDITSAIIAAGSTLQKPMTGIVGEYQFYVKDALAHGLTPMDFNEYQDKDANRKAVVQSAINAAGLTKDQATRVYALMDDYDKQAKDLKTVINASSQIDALSRLALTSNPDSASRATAQIGMIFSFMKMLDPTSTVREGEYATAQNTAGVDEKVRNAYNKIKDGTFLNDAQINGYKATATALAEDKRRKLESLNIEFDRRGSLSGIAPGTITGIYKNTPEASLQNDSQADAKMAELSDSNPALGKQIADFSKKINEATQKPYTPSEVFQLLQSTVNPATKQPWISPDISFKAEGSGSQNAQKLAMAISQHESGGKQVRGASGEFGAFQFLPTTWQKISKEMTGKVLPQTAENEQKIAVAKIEQLLNRGYTPQQVAMVWNGSLGGTEKPVAKRGVNSYGQKYDTVGYANSVMNIYNNLG